MKRIIFIITLLLALASANAQQTGLSVTVGRGTYNLQDLKNYQDELIARMPVEVKGFSNFPPYANIRLNFFKQASSGHKYGLVYGYSSSGAHGNYSDFSGYMNIDQLLVAHQFGASGSYRLFYMNFIELLAYGDIRLSYARNNASMQIVTTYYYEKSYVILNSFSPSAELGLEALVHMKKFSLGVEGGYLFDYGAKFKVGDQSNSTFSLLPETDYRSNMSGFRAGIKAIIWLSNRTIQ